MRREHFFNIQYKFVPLMMIWVRILPLFAAIVLSLLPSSTSWGIPQQQRPVLSSRLKKETIPKSPTLLYMSDIPKENEENRQSPPRPPPRNQNEDEDFLLSLFAKPKLKLPPPPEDVVIFTGDLLTIAVYGVTNYFLSDMNERFVSHAAQTYTQQSLEAEAYREAIALYGAKPASPVWLDTNDLTATHDLSVALLHDQMVEHYSPFLQYAGSATCLLAISWLAAAWIHRAYDFNNTLECSTNKALAVTFRTWFTAVLLMLSALALSHVTDPTAAAVQVSVLQPPTTFTTVPVEWMTKGDMDYIMGSLSVLAMWRFMASFLLGTGED